MKNLIFIFFISALLSTSNFSQGASQIAPQKRKPTIYLEYSCQDKEKVWLKLYNNTSWAITVPTFSFYLNPKKIGKVKLTDGTSVFVLPNDMEIASLFHYVEKDPGAKTSELPLPIVNYPDSFNNSWIAPHDSILFSVPIGHLREGLEIYVSFNYEWELNEQKIIIDEPEHKVLLRGTTLTNIAKPLPCKEKQ